MDDKPEKKEKTEDDLTEQQRLEAYVKNPAEGAKFVDAQKKRNEENKPKPGPAPKAPDQPAAPAAKK